MTAYLSSGTYTKVQMSPEIQVKHIRYYQDTRRLWCPPSRHTAALVTPPDFSNGTEHVFHLYFRRHLNLGVCYRTRVRSRSTMFNNLTGQDCCSQGFLAQDVRGKIMYPLCSCLRTEAQNLMSF